MTSLSLPKINGSCCTFIQDINKQSLKYFFKETTLLMILKLISYNEGRSASLLQNYGCVSDIVFVKPDVEKT